MVATRIPQQERPFPCPRGCLFTLGGMKRFTTFKGWKKHMDEVHKGATPEELETINQILSSSSQAVKSRAELEQEANQAEPPLDEQGNPVKQPPTDKEIAEEAAERESERKKRLTSEAKRINKEINEKMAEIEKWIFQDVPKTIFGAVAASQQSDIFLLTPTQEKLIRDSFDIAMKAVGLDFQIEPWNITIKNPLWVLCTPFVVMAAIFIGKKRKVDSQRAELAGEQPQQEQPIQ